MTSDALFDISLSARHDAGDPAILLSGSFAGGAMRKAIAAGVLSLSAVACGGGGSDDAGPDTESAQGIYSGSTSDSRSLSVLVLSDGSYWGVYSAPGEPSLLAGMVQGTGNASDGRFASTNGLDYNLEAPGIYAAEVEASYARKETLRGSVASRINFTATYDAAYEQSPSLTTIAGTYDAMAGVVSGANGGTEYVTITIASSGAVSGSGESGCAFTGSATPRGDANAYDVAVEFGPSPCFFNGARLRGIGYYDATERQLLVGLVTSSRNGALMGTGFKR